MFETLQNLVEHVISIGNTRTKYRTRTIAILSNFLVLNPDITICQKYGISFRLLSISVWLLCFHHSYDVRNKVVLVFFFSKDIFVLVLFMLWGNYGLMMKFVTSFNDPNLKFCYIKNRPPCSEYKVHCLCVHRRYKYMSMKRSFRTYIWTTLHVI